MISPGGRGELTVVCGPLTATHPPHHRGDHLHQLSSAQISGGTMSAQDAMGASSVPDARAAQVEERPQPPARSQGNAMAGWILTIALNVAAPILTYNALRDQGWSEFAALLASSAWPVLDSAVHLAWRRRL